MADSTEPHINVWRIGLCPACGVGQWEIVAVPKLATGEQYPQFGACDSCGHNVDMRDMPPFLVADDDAR